MQSFFFEAMPAKTFRVACLRTSTYLTPLVQRSGPKASGLSSLLLS